MAEWTKEQSSEFTALYDQLKALPNYDGIREKVDKELFPTAGPLPYNEVKSKLLQMIADNSPKGGLEAKVSQTQKPKGKIASFVESIGSIFSDRPLVPVAGLATAILLLYVGVPYIPPPLY